LIQAWCLAGSPARCRGSAVRSHHRIARRRGVCATDIGFAMSHCRCFATAGVRETRMMRLLLVAFSYWQLVSSRVHETTPRRRTAMSAGDFGARWGKCHTTAAPTPTPARPADPIRLLLAQKRPVQRVSLAVQPGRTSVGGLPPHPGRISRSSRNGALRESHRLSGASPAPVH
jgi:hypothetical protein